MGNQFLLVNFSTRTYVRVGVISGSKEYEIISNKQSAQLVAYYLFSHNGDEIMYIGDEWQVGNGRHDFWDNAERFSDVTKLVIEEFNEFMRSWGSPEQQITLEAKNTK